MVSFARGPTRGDENSQTWLKTWRQFVVGLFASNPSIIRSLVSQNKTKAKQQNNYFFHDPFQQPKWFGRIPVRQVRKIVCLKEEQLIRRRITSRGWMWADWGACAHIVFQYLRREKLIVWYSGTSVRRSISQLQLPRSMNVFQSKNGNCDHFLHREGQSSLQCSHLSK